MLNTLLILVKKDLCFCLRAGGAFTQAVLTGLLLIFLIGMAGAELETPSPRLIASSFWLAGLVSIVLLAPALHRSEKPGLTAILALGINTRQIWLAKTVSLLALLLISQSAYLAAGCLLFDAPVIACSLATAFGIILCSTGLCVLGSMLAPLPEIKAGNQLAGLIFIPLCLPLLLAGINLSTTIYMQEDIDTGRTFLFIIATDLILISAALVLSPFTFREERQ